ncbi:unnamed protein product [Arabidopsis lyrata]|nr:unnamed protein product [Arabidopsis lyrata]
MGSDAVVDGGVAALEAVPRATVGFGIPYGGVAALEAVPRAAVGFGITRRRRREETEAALNSEEEEEEEGRRFTNRVGFWQTVTKQRIIGSSPESELRLGTPEATSQTHHTRRIQGPQLCSSDEGMMPMKEESDFHRRLHSPEPPDPHRPPGMRNSPTNFS